MAHEASFAVITFSLVSSWAWTAIEDTSQVIAASW
jgi:hypothetical protein